MILLFCGALYLASALFPVTASPLRAQDGNGTSPKYVFMSISQTGGDWNLDLLQGSMLILEAADGTRYQSSPLHRNNRKLQCEFFPLPAGTYTLIFDALKLRSSVMIPQISDSFVTLSMNISAQGISILGPSAERVVYEADVIPKTPREPIRVGGNVQESKLIRRVEPVYPDQARRERLQGTVTLFVSINEDGLVYRMQGAQDNDPILEAAAIEAVKQWQYSPTLMNGAPVPVIAQVTVIFALR